MPARGCWRSSKPVRAELPPGPGLIAGVWAWRSAVAMYDAPYVYLAHELDVPLVAADLRLARAATAVGVRAVVPEDG